MFTSGDVYLGYERYAGLRTRYRGQWKSVDVSSHGIIEYYLSALLVGIRRLWRLVEGYRRIYLTAI